MKLQDFLFEMPQEINATEFNLDDAKVNGRVTHDFKMRGEKIEDLDDGLSLYQWGNRVALLLQGEGVKSKIIYLVQWKEIFHKFVGHKAMSQVAVWRDSLDPRTNGIASRIFWEYLLPIHEVLVTDALQTPDGKRFWINRVAEAFKHHFRVYYLNLMQSSGSIERELIEIKSASEFMKLATEKNFWGAEELHRTRKIIISDIVLT